MSLPHEELAALKRTREFMRGILSMRVSDFRKMSKDEFEAWRTEAYYCIKHYPFDCNLDRLWAERLLDIDKHIGCGKNKLK